MGGGHFLAKLMATLVVFLLVSDTTPAAALLPDGSEKMLPAAHGARVGSRKMNAGRDGSAGSVSLENDEGKFPAAGFSIRNLRSRLPSPPPAPALGRQTSTATVTPPPLL